METDMLWKTSLSYQPTPICTSESLGDGHLRREDALGALGTAGLGETAEQRPRCCSHSSLYAACSFYLRPSEKQFDFVVFIMI